MKPNYLARYKAKFSAVNLSKERMDFIEARLDEKNPTDDTSIDAELDALNRAFPFEEIAKTDDKLRNLEAKSKKAAPPKDKDKNDEPADPVDPLKGEDKTDPVLKLLQEMKQEISTLKGEKIAETYTNRAKKDLEEVPHVIYKGRPIPTEEDKYQAFVAEVKADHASFVQEQTDKGFTAMGVPKAGSGGVSDKKASQAEVDAVVQDIMP